MGESGEQRLHALLGSVGMPRIEQCGLARHGHHGSEQFIQHGLWSFHFYHYRGCLETGGARYPFEPFSISILPPEALVRWHFRGDAHHYFIHTAFAADGGPIQPMILDAAHAEKWIRGDLEFLVRHYRQWPTACGVRFWDILWRLALPEADPGQKKSPASAVQIAISVIRNEMDRGIRVSDLAKRCGVSSGHLNRLFRKSHGESAQEFIQRHRLELAEDLLKHSDLPITAIAASVGLKDLQAFNKFIKKRLGAAPRSLRAGSRG